ncbi:relaxase/mobilization nuclease domain-containing protein [Limosilactobacillus reuteri subsp. suis]|uniref:relaxase/mobilization nuclease domain-containing protein n=1 Tax=Limosilactobacillus reuteri TaxID=1598 RepID=UPI003996BC80
MSVISVKTKYHVPPRQNSETGKGCIAYLSDEKSHNESNVSPIRNLRKSSNCGDFKSVARKRFKEQARNSNANVELYSVVQSFDLEELNPENQNDVDKAHKIGILTAKEIMKKVGDREFCVFTQADGESHHLHNHIVILNCDRELNTIRHGLSWKKTLAPINDEITSEQLQNDKQKAVQERLKKSYDEVTALSPAKRKTKRQTENEKKKEYIYDNVNDVLKIAKTQKEFVELLRERQIIIRRNAKEKEFDWLTKSGKYKSRLPFEYQGYKITSKKLINQNPEQILRKLYQNKQKFENKQRQNAKSQADKAIEAKLNDEQVIKPLEIKPQTQNKTPKTPKTANQQLKKQEKTKKKFEKFEERNTNVVRVRKSNISSLTDLELIMAIRKRDLWRNKHFRESNWQNNATYLQLQDKVTFLRSQLTAEIKAQQQAQQTMIATQQAERQIKKREQELET